MHELEVVVAFGLAVAVAGWARKHGRAAPLPVVVLGLVLGMVPEIASIAASPEVILTLALPPLLFGAALESSYIGIRASRRPILMLSVGLVVFTAVVVAAVAKAFVPDMSWPVALTLGAVLGPTDAVAATAIGGRLGLPRKLLTILEGESLVNDGTALTVFRVAVAAAVAGSMTAERAVVILVLAVVGGIGIGLLAGWGLRWLVRHLHDPLLETTTMLLAPFAVYLGAEAVGTSGFLAVVVCGLMISHTAPAEQGFATRLQSTAIWAVVRFVLEAAAFLEVGLLLPTLGRHLIDSPAGVPIVALVLSVFAAVVLSRVVWVVPELFLPWLKGRSPGGGRSTWRGLTVIAWSGMRGPVSLLAALGIPFLVDGGGSFPYRDLLLFVTGVVVLLTLVVQGTTLGPLIRRLGLRETDRTGDLLAEAEAQHHAALAGLAALDQYLAADGSPPPEIVEALRTMAERRANGAWERLGGDAETPTTTYRRLRLVMLDAERDVFLSYRDEGRLSDDVLRAVFRDLDLEEAALQR